MTAEAPSGAMVAKVADVKGNRGGAKSAEDAEGRGESR